MATVIEENGHEWDMPVDEDPIGIRALLGGDFVCHRSGTIFEAMDWNHRGLAYNKPASEKFGMALHGRIVWISHNCTSTGR